VTGRALALRYGAFAVAATLANLAAQRAVLAARDDATGFAAAVAAGTLVGLALKYVLDKRWIFGDRATGLAAHGQRFTLYTATGVVTTALFWSTESAFWLIWGSDLMREAGAVLGLAVGYVIKYRLDRRFVFPPAGGAGSRHA
jgi:putative flippase GtrA